MKNLFLPALLVAALSANAQNPEIKNNTFADWKSEEFSTPTTSDPLKKITVDYPTSWTSSDLIIARDAGQAILLAGLELSNQTFEVAGLVNSTDKAVEIRTIQLQDTIFVPGVLMNADVELDISKVIGGGEIDIDAILGALTLKSAESTQGKRIDSIKVVVKTGAANVEPASVEVSVFKKYGDSIDGIGGSEFIIANHADSVQTIVIPVAYEDTNLTIGDHFMVSFYSSSSDVDDDVEVLTVGNSLTIDQVEVYFSEGKGDTATSIVQPLLGNTLAVYPNPAMNNVHFNLQAGLNPADYSLAIFDQLGRAVYARQLTEVLNTISVSNWNAGIYTYQLVAGAKAVKTGQIVVK